MSLAEVCETRGGSSFTLPLLGKAAYKVKSAAFRPGEATIV